MAKPEFTVDMGQRVLQSGGPIPCQEVGFSSQYQTEMTQFNATLQPESGNAIQSGMQPCSGSWTPPANAADIQSITIQGYDAEGNPVGSPQTYPRPWGSGPTFRKLIAQQDNEGYWDVETDYGWNP